MVTKTCTCTWFFKIIRIPLFIIVSAGLFLVNPALGQEWKITNGFSQTRTKGMRKNLQRDRKEATADALRDACEQLGVKISSLTEVKNYVTKYDLINTEASQKIEFERVSEVYTEDGPLQVTIKFRKKTISSEGIGAQPDSNKTSQPSVPLPESNKLVIKVLRATGIPRMDIFDESDPFVVVSMYGVEIGRTIHIPNNPNPVWNQTFSIPTYKGEPLRFDVYDEDVVSRADWIGCVILEGVKYNQFDQEQPYKQISGTYNIIKPGVAGSFGQLVLSFDE